MSESNTIEFEDPPLSPRVLAAMRDVPRADFLPQDVRHLADHDGPLPIGEGQTNSQPYTVAIMLTLLDVQPGMRVLDVGAGSGWTTGILANLVGTEGRVIGVERRTSLIEPASRALARHATGTARIERAVPGALGLPHEAPFDRILVSAMASHLPTELVSQLAEGGIMVIPVATTMKRVRRRNDTFDVTNHGQFLFVPLVED